jgi:TAG lipase/steryl ester hydrolase/phospholipase A2/LPA acyltransferase
MTASNSSELRYKRLFNPPEKAANSVHPPVDPQVIRAVENTIAPAGNMEVTAPTLQHTNSNPEAQKVLPPAMVRTDSFPETKMRELGMLPEASSSLTSVPPVPMDDVQPTTNDTSKKLSRKEKKEVKEAERERRSLSRRGSAQGSGIGLLLDISGTRGMLRRKKSAIFGSSYSQG